MWKIGQLAQRSGCSIETIRYYEQQHLLPKPSRSAGNFRLYDATHLQQLQFIRHCRSLDIRLEEIRQLLRYRQQPEQEFSISNKCGCVSARYMSYNSSYCVCALNAVGCARRRRAAFYAA